MGQHHRAIVEIRELPGTYSYHAEVPTPGTLERDDMKSFACGEVVPDCPAVFSGRDFEDVLRQVADHARAAHGLVEVPPEVSTAVLQACRQADERSHDLR